MSISSLEVEMPHFEDGSVVREKRILQPYDEQFDEWLAVRHEFMARKGWREDEVREWDVYDDNPATAHVVLYGENQRLLFGMRLTPVASPEVSMSWQMVERSTIHRQVAEKEQQGDIFPATGMWDLTRLVPGCELRSDESYEAIPRLFHEGLVHCQRQGDDNPAWIFALDVVTHRWLASQGVQVSTLGRGRVGNDRQDTIFGIVYPAEIDQANGDFARRSRQGAV